MVYLDWVNLGHFSLDWVQAPNGWNFAASVTWSPGFESPQAGALPMPDLTLSDLRGLSEKELRRRLREEAYRLFGPGGLRGPPSDDLCPVSKKDFLCVKRSFLEKFFSEARESPRQDLPKARPKKRVCRKPRGSSE
jgi:hypothetical protein